MSSVFLDKPRSEWVACNELAFAIRDGFPVSEGHTLVIPRRPVPDWRAATDEERAAVMALVNRVMADLDVSHAPDGYNVGFNAGAAAGQTVMHLHVHVIPRYRGDVADPRGGVRHVIPGKGNYLARRAAPLATGGRADPFSAHLRPLLRRAHTVSIVAAFVQDSGLDVLRDGLFAALERGARVRVLTGDYLHITQARALQRLLDWTREWAARGEEGAAGVFEGRVIEVRALDATTFHPKSWRFEGEGSTLDLCGRRIRLLGRSARGGVRIDGGPGGFKARTVSRTDLAWVLKARASLPASGVLDEPAVNHLRYLEGTPKGATRWIDTGHAIRLVQALEAQGQAQASGSATPD